jgi:hypothetical protein
MLFKEAKEEGMIESQPLPEVRLNHLKEASLLKRERALNAIKESEQTGGVSR